MARRYSKALGQNTKIGKALLIIIVTQEHKRTGGCTPCLTSRGCSYLWGYFRTHSGNGWQVVVVCVYFESFPFYSAWLFYIGLHYILWALS